MRIRSYPELKSEHGIRYTREHIRRLEEKGKFPRHIELGDGGSIGWIEEEIVAYLQARADARKPAAEAALRAARKTSPERAKKPKKQKRGSTRLKALSKKPPLRVKRPEALVAAE